MSGKEKDANYGEVEIIKVTCGDDKDERPVIEEERVVRAPGFRLWSSEAVISPDFLLGHRLGVVSEADAIGRDI